MIVCGAVLTILTLLPEPGDAGTWRVEKDGSGDFTVIQDAIDAAAPGDSILIGPGRYDERPYYETAKYIGRITAMIDKSDLTLIGAGSDVSGTIIGPTVPDYEVNQRQTIGVFFVEGSVRPKLVALRIENMNIGLADLASDVVIQDCQFLEYGRVGVAIIADVNGLTVEDCVFGMTRFDGVKAIGADVGATSNNMIVRRSRFTGNHGAGIATSDGDALLIEDRDFSGFATALDVRGMTNGLIQRCRVSDNIGNNAIYVREFSNVRIVESEFGGALSEFGVRLTGSTVEFELCLIRGGSLSAVRPEAGGNYRFRNCRIERQPGTLFVESFLTTDFTEQIDMRYNWWGTADSTTIANGILDARTADPQECIDNPTLFWCPRDTVDFWPVLDTPPFVPVVPGSVSGLKGRFRGRD